LAGLNKLQRVNHSKAYQTAVRELLLAGPAGVRRHPSSVFVEVLQLEGMASIAHLAAILAPREFGHVTVEVLQRKPMMD
ncbi:hypothetical protein, partial [Rhizobium leguminosarum]|uniref:hypothetical protein n=1 Tax=Rhizobium leguminosarum TaxID=384 RepID=UPI003F976A4A